VNPGKVNEYGPAEAPAGCVVTSVRHDPTTAYGIYFTYRPLSVFINGGWRVIEG
ncbi:phage tail protein, partial [Serratia marcescens]